MELEVKPTISIKDGLHSGVIEKVEYRTDPYNYTDVIVKVDGDYSNQALAPFKTPY